ncbi:hypothetical protein [Paraburkholderia sp. DHOC27]|uniref:hypothetical protein n=1 Tax=Paraburkholderia sp. DHOC27 TaxID=2303330 RepID=UPI000E3E2922|nr:hypothetical protein [Paraburkholderia sp. DHOC27]RFU45377.1 hypothetical protein D0B32_22405 [Paraburkholderia sp. DHOC27]
MFIKLRSTNRLLSISRQTDLSLQGDYATSTPSVAQRNNVAPKHASLARVLLIGGAAAVALSGCGVFCGAGGGSGGGFAGGCATGMRF